MFSTESSLVSNGLPFLSFPFSWVTFKLLGLASVEIVLTGEMELESVLAVEMEVETVLAVEIMFVADVGCDCDREL